LPDEPNDAPEPNEAEAKRLERWAIQGRNLDEPPRSTGSDTSFTEIESEVAGVTSFRRMTEQEVQRYDDAVAKDRVKVQPAEIEGVPTL